MASFVNQLEDGSSRYLCYAYDDGDKDVIPLIESGNVIYILIQITKYNNEYFLIDALTGYYIKPPIEMLRPPGPGILSPEIINSLLMPIYARRQFSIKKLMPFQLQNNKVVATKADETDTIELFLNRCNPRVILPVDITKKKRFFVREEEDIDEEISTKQNVPIIEEFYAEAIVDVKAPQVLIKDMCSTDITCLFIDPLTNIKYQNLPLGIHYDEVTEEYFNDLKDQINPLQYKQNNGELISNIDQLEKVIDTKLEKTVILRTKSAIEEQIQAEFGKHLSFNYPFINIEINKTNVEPTNSTNSDNLGSLLNAIEEKSKTNKAIKIRFEIVNFIRSYVDLYHDITTLGENYCPTLYELFKMKLTKNRIDASEIQYLDTKISDARKVIFTSSGKISQTRCKEFVEKMVDEYIDYLYTNGITTIPKTKENAIVMTASTFNDAEVDSLIATLEKDGVKGFYVESANNSIGQILYLRSDKKLKIFNLNIGEWDAGSGFSGKKLKDPQIISYGNDKIPNQILNLFGTVNISVSPDNKFLKTTYDEKNSDNSITEKSFNIAREETGNKAGLKFSVNRLTLTTDDTIMRGVSGGTDEDSDSGKKEKKVLPIKTQPQQINNKSSKYERAALISLKTWTDLIQIYTISKLMSYKNNKANPVKILTIIYDGLCETTARMYGLGHVLKTEGKLITYYNYNTASRKLTPEQILKKSKLKAYILSEEPNKIIRNYLDKWFASRLKTLRNIKKTFYEPVLYFTSKLFFDKYLNANDKSIKLLNDLKNTDIKLMPYNLDDYIESITSSASLLAEFVETLNKFETAINRIETLGTRGDYNIFLDAYDFVEQQIVNTFSNADKITLRAMVASTFAYVFLKKQRYAGPLAKLEDVKQTLITEINRTNRILNIKQSQIGYVYVVEDKREKKNAYNEINLYESLSKIKNINESTDALKEYKKRLQSLSDIQITCQELIKVPYYTKYIQTVSGGTIDLREIFSFEQIISKSEKAIEKSIHNNGYFGGKRKIQKHLRTFKHKQKKNKTYKKRN